MQRTVEPLAALLPDANPGYVKTGLAETETLTIALPPGRYTMRFQPSGGRASGYFSLQTWASVPLTFRSFLSPKTAPSPRMYFFVPYGQRQIVMYYPNSDYAGAFKFEVLDPEGKPAALQARDGRRTLVVQVPPGMDGRIWSLNHSVSPDEPLQMLSTPQAFSLAPELLRVPRDAL